MPGAPLYLGSADHPTPGEATDNAAYGETPRMSYTLGSPGRRNFYSLSQDPPVLRSSAPVVQLLFFQRTFLRCPCFSFQENSPRDLKPAVDCIVLEGRVVLELVIEA